MGKDAPGQLQRGGSLPGHTGTRTRNAPQTDPPILEPLGQEEMPTHFTPVTKRQRTGEPQGPQSVRITRAATLPAGSTASPSVVTPFEVGASAISM